MKKNKISKLLVILHRAPPAHGAAKVGDFIALSEKLNENFDCRFITIKSSDTIGDIGKVNLKKLYFVVELYIRVLWALVSFRPDKIYFTASISSVAFYRDLLISTLWKSYKLFKSPEVYYHYHTKGIDEFVTTSDYNLKLTRFFLKDVNLILLTPILKNDFQKVQTYKQALYLPNGVENTFEDLEFKEFIDEKYKQIDSIEILYLSNMIKSKGYFSVLELANQTKDQLVHYHFAGAWQNIEDEKEFFEYIKQNNLEKKVTFHGFVNGEKKQALLRNAHVLAFPTRYKAESFGLVIVEAMSYGVPVIATDEGSIPSILDEKSGIILHDLDKLPESLNQIKQKFLNTETAMYCRKRYLKNFSLDLFEENLVKTLK